MLPNDPMDPIADGAGANTGPLSGALLVTRDLVTTRRAYVDAAGMRLNGPLASAPATVAAQRLLWQLPPDLGWQCYLLTRPSLPDAIRILVIVPDLPTPVIRRSFAREETGPYALGFPMPDVRAVDRRFIACALRRTLPDVNEYSLQMRDGTHYPVTEASYETADNTRLVLMQRGAGLPQTGSVDAATNLGGPAYSSAIVEDATAMEAFFTQVLDLERRSSREWTVFTPKFRYITLHARGARTGNLGLVEYAADDRICGTGVAARPPNRGLAGWSFPVKRVDELLTRARAANCQIVCEGVQYDDPRFGAVRAASLLAPNGMLIELLQPLS